jgi:hypothetical protein
MHIGGRDAKVVSYFVVLLTSVVALPDDPGGNAGAFENGGTE